MHVVDAVTNSAVTWFNDCPDGGGDDPDTMTTPPLPAPPDIDTPPRQVRGYIAFGDSYAAGMGTANTTTDKCRIGGNNIGDLIKGVIGHEGMYYKRTMCSGDTVEGLNSKIDAWKKDETTEKAEVATVSIGGNDLGFSDLVTNCIITPMWSYATYRKYCTTSLQDARKKLDDLGNTGLRSQLKEAYKKIVNTANTPVCIIPSWEAP